MLVGADQTIQVNFGDIVIEDVDFDVIELSSTDQALSLGSSDLGEDNKNDPDLVLGTRSAGGSNNVLIWHNERLNHRTPNGAIFETTPTASRSAGSDVMALSIADLGNGSGKAMILGLAGVTSNLSVWSIENGLPQDVPMAYYATMGGDAVLDMYPRAIAGSGYTDLIVGVDRGGLRGHYEMWKGQGSGSFYREDGDVISSSADDISLVLGEVTAVEMADFNGDGYTDVAIGAIQQLDFSCVHVYLRDPMGPGLSFKGHQSIPVQGAVRDVVAVDMIDDNSGTVDLLIATEQWTTTGGVALWLQKADGYFGLPLPSRERGMDDWMPTHGAPLVMKVTQVDNDAFPDLLVGTRYGSTFKGQLDLARGFGYLPSVPTLVNDVPLGAVVTMTVNDFNLDSASDVAIGTQDDSSSGRVIVLYRQQ